MFKSFFEKILGKENNNKSKPKSDVKIDSLSAVEFPKEIKVEAIEAIEVVKEISVDLVKQQETKPKKIKGTRRSSGVKLQAWADVQAQLTVNGVELYKVYKKGFIDNPEQYVKIKNDERINVVAFNEDYEKFNLYSSPSLVVERIKSAYQHCDKEFIIPASNTFYYIEGNKFEILVPKTMYFKSEFMGEVDEELEIIMFRNLMSNQLERECRKRGIEF